MNDHCNGPIAQYVKAQDASIQPFLIELYEILRSVSDDATEKIAYGIPTFYLDGNLIHFAAHKHHMGLYPGPEAIEAFSGSLGNLSFSKGAIQLPYGQPLPKALLQDIVRYCVSKNRNNKKDSKRL